MERTENITLFGTKALEMLFDNGNYTEIGAHVTRGHGSEEYEGVVTAYGPMSGRLVFAFAQDSDRMKGAFDSRTAKKIENLYELALKSGAPVVGVFASSGSVITEGSSLLGGLLLPFAKPATVLLVVWSGMLLSSNSIRNSKGFASARWKSPQAQKSVLQ